MGAFSHFLIAPAPDRRNSFRITGKAPHIAAELFFFLSVRKIRLLALRANPRSKKREKRARKTGPAHPLAGERPGAPSGGREKEKEEKRKKRPKGRQAKGWRRKGAIVNKFCRRSEKAGCGSTKTKQNGWIVHL